MNAASSSSTLARVLPDLGKRTLIMGILNVTPDSFSDGGRHQGIEAAVEAGLRMEEEGADILDLGGESSRPGATPVSAAEEQSRVLPVIERLASRLRIPMSIDTYRADTALRALKAGARIVNDIWGLQRDPQMAPVAAAMDAPVIAMHNRTSANVDTDILAEISRFFEISFEIAGRSGIPRVDVILDPGIGFGKTLDQNIDAIARLGELRRFGQPLLVGASRKSIIGAITGRPVEDRVAGTLGLHMAAISNGASILRVHDVRAHVDAARVADAIARHRTVRAALAFGGNIGDVRATFRAAIARLGAAGIRVVARSSDFETPPWGKIDQPNFVNACVIAETELAPRQLLDACLAIEADLGRRRTEKWGPRVIDIDILTYGNHQIDEPGLTIPHPRLTSRAFVLAPLAEIAPHLVVSGQTIGDWLAQLDGSGITRLP